MQYRAISSVIGILVGAIGLSLTPALQAQFSANFQTNAINGVFSNWTGSYVVGSNTFLDALQITNGGVLSNGTGFIGYETSASNNAVYVVDAGSVWFNRTNVYVGYNGAGNRLIITNGGSVFCAANFFAPSYVGYNSSSSNNAVLVSGVGSIWTNGSDINVGYSGSANTLTITNGGKMFSSNFGYIGNNNSSKSNKMLVTGTGSLWSNNAVIYVGNSGGGNSLTIADGGKVFAGAYGYVGNSSSSNSAMVTGTNAAWIIGGSIYVGYTGSGNSLTMSNGGAVVGGPFITDANIGYFGGTSNSVLVTGTGSVWSNINGITIGLEPTCSGNSLTVTNGGTVLNLGNATVGNSGSANMAFVSGTGSVWTNGGSLVVGSSGPGNTLTITSGGKVTSIGGTIGGSSALAGNNVIAIIGSGSVWSNSGDLAVGSGGSGNEFILFNGGSAYNGNAYIGNGGSSTLASTFGGGSVWYNRGNLYVGYSTDINHLQVGSSSTVVASNAYVGYNGGSFNLVDVQGGNFYVTNAAHNAVLEVRCGQLNVSSGLLQVDILVCTNACGHISHTGGTLIAGSLVLDPNLSAVGDGIPNGWKQQHGLDPFDPNLGNKDADGDGMSNLQEFLAGTDPTNSASSFRITSVVGTGSDVLVSWMTGIGRTNALQATTSGGYATNGFADLFVVTNTVGTTTNFLDVGGAMNMPNRFYRVRLVP
jgi:T5SS/PEP-CTERM-associated repeat protein